MPRNRPVTNEVLLERLIAQDDKLKDQKENFAAFKASVDQNFSSLANLLDGKYVTKDQLQPYIDRIKDLEAEIQQRVHVDTWKPYGLIFNTIGGLSLAGFVSLVGKMIYDYVQGGPPQ